MVIACRYTSCVSNPDRNLAGRLFAWSLLLYAFFFQGVGANQGVRFATLHAIATRYSADLTPWRGMPLVAFDVVEVRGRLLAPQPPGVVLLGLPIYWPLVQIERLAGLDVDSPAVMRWNMRAMTIVLASIPAATINAMLFLAFRRRGVDRRTAFTLALAFAAGGLVFPYASVLMSHAMTAALLLGGHLLAQRSSNRIRLFAAGVLLGLASACDLLAVGAAGIITIAHFLHSRRLSGMLPIVVGGAIGVTPMLVFNSIVFGSVFRAGPAVQPAFGVEESMWLGMFHGPELIRLYWLTIHPMRGIAWSMPLILVPLAGVFMGRGFVSFRERMVIGLMAAWFVGFLMCFRNWPGGACFGPRYLVPMLPVFFLFAADAWKRLCWIAPVLAILSAALMLAVSAVGVTIPGPSAGDALPINPTMQILESFVQGRLHLARDASSLATEFGLPPTVGLLIPITILVLMLRERHRIEADREPVGV